MAKSMKNPDELYEFMIHAIKQLNMDLKFDREIAEVSADI